MTKRIDWDEVGRRERSRRHGTEDAYDELPPVGSRADQQRYFLPEKTRGKIRTPRPKTTPVKKVEPMPLTQCPLCGVAVGKMKRHLRRAHGAVPGREHEAPANTPSKDQITT